MSDIPHVNAKYPPKGIKENLSALPYPLHLFPYLAI